MDSPLIIAFQVQYTSLPAEGCARIEKSDVNRFACV